MNTILIIDDNLHLLESLTMVIGMWLNDCTILTARNGIEGISMIDSKPVELILTDLDMPVLDGFGVIDYRNRKCPQVPLVVMSGSLCGDTGARLGGLHVTGCIEKPFSFQQITDTIRRVLNIEPAADAGSSRSLLQQAG